MVKFSKFEIDYLVSNYADTQNKDISIKLNRNIYSILKQAKELGLRKSRSQRSKMISKRNKMVGRDLSEEFLSKIALNYKSRVEFQIKDPSAYTSARRYGILDKICHHMTSSSFSLPQLMAKKIIQSLITNNLRYNDRKEISPYEIDIFLPEFNLAFEYDGRKWHVENKNDKIKEKMMIDKNIQLIRLKENSRKYEDDVKFQFISNLNLINRVTNLSLNENDINNIDLKSVYYDVIDKEDIKNICMGYDKYHLFRKEQLKIYNKLVRYKLLDEFTNHMDRENPLVKWNINKCEKEISKYDKLSDFISKSQGCYLFILKHKLNYLYSHLEVRKSYWSNIDNIKDEISKFHNLSDFIKKSRRCYSYIIDNKLHYLLNSLKRDYIRVRWDDDLLRVEINKYSNLMEFKKGSRGAYRHILRNKKDYLLKDAF